MANTITINPVLDTKNETILQVYLESDNSSGELTDQVIFDASALLGAGFADSILEIEGCLSGFSAKLEFDATTDIGAVVLPDNSPFHFCFNPKVHNFAYNTTGATGDITITTNGFTVTGDKGFFILKVNKIQ